ncbi:MAG TPA: threonine synthase [Patescibacteria group bacterium]|nr:threonine synthase [Patescibacteria group bacterium]
MIKYQSTRGNKAIYTFSEAILKGIASDGGLLIPDKIPQFSLSEIQALENHSYQEVAFTVFKKFETDLSDDVLKQVIHKAYGSQFDTKDITPVVHLKGNQYLLELWHGPTSAFKDMALQLMPLLFSEAIVMHDKAIRYFILVATSGDTGKAALEGYKDLPGISIIVLYPKGHVSQIQQLQMETQEGSNVTVLAVDGDFDDCQRAVKEIFTDKQFQEKLFETKLIRFSSANSINWGRLIPQIIYYFFAYMQLVKQKAMAFGEEIDVVIPSGNFGNSLAGFYAKKMGLPIRKITCASNENNVLTEFIKTGIYDIRNRHIVQTASPAIDILIASNIERLLYLLTQDTKQVALWMQDLQTKQIFIIDSQTKQVLQETFDGGWVNTKDCLANIKSVFDETGYVMDTHTAVAQKVAEELHTKNSVLIFSTAHFAKFAHDVYAGLTGKMEEGSEFNLLSKIQKIAPQVRIPDNIAALEKKKRLHTKTSSVGKQAVEAIITHILQ